MYLSHLRKTEIRNFSSVLRILWDEFRNYLIHVCGYLPMGTNMHMIYNIKCFTGLFNVSRETFDTTAFDTTLIFNESHECPVAADMQCALVCSLAHITSYFQDSLVSLE